MVVRMLSWVLLMVLTLPGPIRAQGQKVWVDADTGNEMDDVWALVRLLWAHGEGIELVGLSSAHFNSADLLVFERWNQYPTEGIQPVRISQALNAEILHTMGLEHLPHPLGADRMMGRSWGGRTPRPSPATEAMLDVIAKLGPGERLDILTLGALTNVASLLALDSTVVDKIRLYSMGLQYDAEADRWGTNEFNARRDLNAVDFLFDQPGLEWFIMPATTCLPYRYDRDEAYERFADDQPVEQLMEDRWRETNPQDQTRILWDLALVQAYLKPELATLRQVPPPPGHTAASIGVYTDIDVAGMTDDFWAAVQRRRAAFQRPSDKARLGEVHYGNRVGGLIGQMAPTVHLLCLEEGDELRQIEVCLRPDGQLVQGFRLQVADADGRLRSCDFGHVDDGRLQPPYRPEPGQVLIGIAGAAGWYIDRLQFLFSDGSSSPVYGGPGGDQAFRLELARDPEGAPRGRLLGFWGSHTDVLESIGLVFWPEE